MNGSLSGIKKEIQNNKIGRVGRKALSTESQKQELKYLLEQQEYWTLKEIIILIKEKYNVEYSDQQVRNILRKHQMLCSKPYPIDYRMPEDAEDILEKHLQEVFEELQQKQVAPQDIAIGFLDESSP